MLINQGSYLLFGGKAGQPARQILFLAGLSSQRGFRLRAEGAKGSVEIGKARAGRLRDQIDARDTAVFKPVGRLGGNLLVARADDRGLDFATGPARCLGRVQNLGGRSAGFSADQSAQWTDG